MSRTTILLTILIASASLALGCLAPGPPPPCIPMGDLCVRPDAYGRGVGADQYGRPVRVILE